MCSIYQQVLGPAFTRLHPQIQRRFGFSSADRVTAIGTGVMEKIWHGTGVTIPFLFAGTFRNIMFPETGSGIPFTVVNHAYVDSLGRETVSWIRTFNLARRQRRFDAYMIYSSQRRRIVDYLGTHQHLAVDLSLSVDPRGGLRIRSGEQRFYEGLIGFCFPSFLTGIADVCEWYDDEAGCFRIEVNVANGRRPLFGYHGHFQVDWRRGGPDFNIFPRRIERRE